MGLRVQTFNCFEWCWWGLVFYCWCQVTWLTRALRHLHRVYRPNQELTERYLIVRPILSPILVLMFRFWWIWNLFTRLSMSFLLLIACSWVDCGGGLCNKTSPLTYKCNCLEGYYNLLNITAFPCYKDCKLTSSAFRILMLLIAYSDLCLVFYLWRLYRNGLQGTGNSSNKLTCFYNFYFNYK